MNFTCGQSWAFTSGHFLVSPEEKERKEQSEKQRERRNRDVKKVIAVKGRKQCAGLTLVDESLTLPRVLHGEKTIREFL